MISSFFDDVNSLDCYTEYLSIFRWWSHHFNPLSYCDVTPPPPPLFFLFLTPTADTLTELFLVHSCKRERERSRLSRGPHFLNLRSHACTHWSMRWGGPRDIVLSRQEYATKDLRELPFLEKNSFLGYFENLHFGARGRFLRCLHNFQYLVAGISCNPRSSSLVSHTNLWVSRVGSHATALNVPFIFHKAS